MVDAVLSFAVQRLGDLLIEQVVFLRGVKDDVLWLRDKLDYLKCFLKDAEGKQDVDYRMRKCGLTELVCSCAGGFPQLQILRIVVCDVNKLQVEEGGMPVLKGLSIQGNCDLSIPDRLRTFPAPHPRIDWFEWAY